MRARGPWALVLAFVLVPVVWTSFARGQEQAGANGATATALDGASPRGRLIEAIGLQYEAVADPVKALAGSRYRVVVADATPANLAALADAPAQVTAFCERGGWLMLWGLEPEGLPHFNKLVGVDHIIRPFRTEEVDLPGDRDRLVEGISPTDVFMESGKWSGGNEEVPLRADDAFTYVVDYDDVAPFCTLPGPDYWNKEAAQIGNDHWPGNLVNGLTYHWRLGFTIILHKGQPTKWQMGLPREEEIVGFSIAPGTIYHRITKVRLYFDGGEPVELDVKPHDRRQDFAFDGRTATRIGIELAEWDNAGSADVIAVKNLWIKARRSPEFYAKVRPLLNIPVLVKYAVGEGGVVLNQLNVLDTEGNARNVKKKRAIVRHLLKNMGARFEE